MTDFTSKDHNAPVSVTNYCSSPAPLWITVCTKMFKLDAEIFAPALTTLINTFNSQELSAHGSPEERITFPTLIISFSIYCMIEQY